MQLQDTHFIVSCSVVIVVMVDSWVLRLEDVLRPLVCLVAVALMILQKMMQQRWKQCSADE